MRLAMLARIYRPAKNAMQSGRANAQKWVLDYAPHRAQHHDALMGWVGSDDTCRQIRLKFPDKDAAVAYARKAGIDFEVFAPHERRLQLKN